MKNFGDRHASGKKIMKNISKYPNWQPLPVGLSKEQQRQMLREAAANTAREQEQQREEEA